MGKNKEKRSSLTLSEHFKLCFGILLISLSIIALTGKTAVGEFFAYGFAYLFGTFFPAFAAAFLLLGVVLLSYFFTQPLVLCLKLVHPVQLFADETLGKRLLDVISK